MSVPAHVARLASKWELVSYTVKIKDVASEILTRGALLASVRITDQLLDAVSSRLQPEDSPDPRVDGLQPDSTDGDSNHGSVVVAVLGWEDGDWIVALPWGKFGSPAWDGTLTVAHAAITNVCGLAKQEEVSRSHDTGSITVGVLPPTWDPPTTQPLPAVAHIGSVTGKHKAIRRKKLQPAPKPPPSSSDARATSTPTNLLTTVSTWMTEEHMNITVQCSVTLVIIIVGILTLLLMRRPKVRAA